LYHLKIVLNNNKWRGGSNEDEYNIKYHFTVQCLDVSGERLNGDSLQRSFLHLDHLVSKLRSVLSSIKTQFDGGPVIEYKARKQWMPIVDTRSLDEIEAIVNGRIILRDKYDGDHDFFTKEGICENFDSIEVIPRLRKKHCRRRGRRRLQGDTQSNVSSFDLKVEIIRLSENSLHE
jgi:hypothetical protein